jgi:hypothetical protein
MKSRRILRIVSFISVLISCAFSTIGIVRPDLLVPPALGHDHTLVAIASYAAARSIAIAIVCIVALFGRKRDPLYLFAILAALFQFLDAFVGIYLEDLSKVAGPLILALLGFVFTYYASKSKDSPHGV